jgi:hypothetical protein
MCATDKASQVCWILPRVCSGNSSSVLNRTSAIQRVLHGELGSPQFSVTFYCGPSGSMLFVLWYLHRPWFWRSPTIGRWSCWLACSTSLPSLVSSHPSHLGSDVRLFIEWASPMCFHLDQQSLDPPPIHLLMSWRVVSLSVRYSKFSLSGCVSKHSRRATSSGRLSRRCSHWETRESRK